MRGLIGAVVLGMMLVLSVNGFGETFPASITRKPLAVGQLSERLTVGFGYERLEREVEFDRLPDSILKADIITGYVGYDVLPWLTVSVTAGGSKVAEDGDVKTDYAATYSAGVSAYLWEGDILVPAYMAGRISIKAMVDLSRSESDTDLGSVDWMNVFMALPFGYEKFDRYPVSGSGIETSLALYAGPAVSFLSGTADTPIGGFDFDEEQQFGVLAGADVFLSPSVAIGAKVIAFDEISYGATARIHF
jgi:hypothetical protein